MTAAKRAALTARRKALTAKRESRKALEACLRNFDRVEFTSDGFDRITADLDILRSMGR